MFVLMLTSQTTVSQSFPQGSSWVQPVIQGFPLTLFGGHYVPLGLEFKGHFKFYGDIKLQVWSLGLGVLDLNCKKHATEKFQQSNQSSQKPYRKENQSLILQDLPKPGFFGQL